MRRFHRATGALAIASTLEPAQMFQLEEMRIHLSAAGASGNLTVTLDANAGATYDTILFTQDMTSIVDLHWQPTRPINFTSGDKLVVAWANAGTKTYGLEMIWSSLH